MSSLTYASFPDELRQQVSGFERVYEEHVNDYNQVLPHVLMGDLVRFLGAEVEREGASNRSVRRALSLLDAAMDSRDEQLQELIAVSFLENLDPSEPGHQLLMSLLGPRLREEMEARRP